MKIKEMVKKYGKNKDHLIHTSFLALELFKKIKPFFKELEKYDNEDDLNLLKYGAMLHDIGIEFEVGYDIPHHKAGAKYILSNRPFEIKEKDLKVLASLIRYHRRSLPSEKHRLYSSLSLEDKQKVNYLGSIIRLADSMDFGHLGLIEEFNIEYDFLNGTLTFDFPDNIMINKELVNTMRSKADFFEKVYSVKTEFKRG